MKKLETIITEFALYVSILEPTHISQSYLSDADVWMDKHKLYTYLFGALTSPESLEGNTIQKELERVLSHVSTNFYGFFSQSALELSSTCMDKLPKKPGYQVEAANSIKLCVNTVTRNLEIDFKTSFYIVHPLHENEPDLLTKSFSLVFLGGVKFSDIFRKSGEIQMEQT